VGKLFRKDARVVGMFGPHQDCISYRRCVTVLGVHSHLPGIVVQEAPDFVIVIGQYLRTFFGNLSSDLLEPRGSAYGAHHGNCAYVVRRGEMAWSITVLSRGPEVESG